MNFVSRPGRFAAWIAILAILLAALAPSMARAFASPQKAMPWSDICSIAGTGPAHDSVPGQPSGPHESAGYTHCIFCLHHSGHFALPSTRFGLLTAAAAAAEVFPPSAATPPPRFIRAAAQPRAPPAIS
jgi:hypothetical protein